jgi:hypothetical protein
MLLGEIYLYINNNNNNKLKRVLKNSAFNTGCVGQQFFR